MNITPIEKIADEAAERCTVFATEYPDDKFQPIIAAAIRQALKEREKFMDHKSNCEQYLSPLQKQSGMFFTVGPCTCGFDEVKKEIKQ